MQQLADWHTSFLQILRSHDPDMFKRCVSCLKKCKLLGFFSLSSNCWGVPGADHFNDEKPPMCGGCFVRLSCTCVRLRAASCDLRATFVRLRVPSCNLRAPSCDLRAPSCAFVRPSCAFVHLRAPSCDLRAPSCAFVRPSCDLRAPSCAFVRLRAPSCGFGGLFFFLIETLKNPFFFFEFHAKSAQNRKYGNSAVFREIAARIWPFAFSGHFAKFGSNLRVGFLEVSAELEHGILGKMLVCLGA